MHKNQSNGGISSVAIISQLVSIKLIRHQDKKQKMVVTYVAEDLYNALQLSTAAITCLYLDESAADKSLHCLFAGTADGLIYVYQIVKLSCILVLKGHQGKISHVLASGGNRVVTASSSGEVFFWKRTTSSTAAFETYHTLTNMNINSMQLTSNGEIVLIASDQNKLTAFDVSTAQSIPLKLPANFQQANVISNIQPSPDNKSLLVVSKPVATTPAAAVVASPAVGSNENNKSTTTIRKKKKIESTFQLISWTDDKFANPISEIRSMTTTGDVEQVSFLMKASSRRTAAITSNPCIVSLHEHEDIRLYDIQPQNIIPYHLQSERKMPLLTMQISASEQWIISVDQYGEVTAWDISSINGGVGLLGEVFGNRNNATTAIPRPFSIQRNPRLAPMPIAMLPCGSEYKEILISKSLKHIYAIDSKNRNTILHYHAKLDVERHLVTQRRVNLLPAQRQAELNAAATSIKDSRNTNKKESSSALNDMSKGGIDRLGYSFYCKALYRMLNPANPPVCVGLYAKWGAGKSFMIDLLKREFDPFVRENPRTKELMQRFDKRYLEGSPSEYEIKVQIEEEKNKSLQATMKKSFNITAAIVKTAKWSFKLWVMIAKATKNRIPYPIATLIGLLLDILDDLLQIVFKVLSYVAERLLYPCLNKMVDAICYCYCPDACCYRDQTKIHAELHDVDDGKSEESEESEDSEDDDVEGLNDLESNAKVKGAPQKSCFQMPQLFCRRDPRMKKRKMAKPLNAYQIWKKIIKTTNTIDKEVMKVETEYVFVDFNAWEFSRSDELWAGLIRNIYQRVELRFRNHKSRRDNSVTNWQRIWRVAKAKKALIDRYGGLAALRFQLLLLICIVTAIPLLIILANLNVLSIYQQIIKKTSKLAAFIGAGLSALLAIVPMLRFLFFVQKDASTSQGDKIFQEANQIQDYIGFMTRVRQELDELFAFIEYFRDSEGIDLKLLLFIDDLDRCFEGRNVKVLEAIQLILAIPGAPVVVFLTLDSRVVVASIEATINQTINVDDAVISGWEYLDKIVQLPFCLPEPKAVQIQSLLRSCVQPSQTTEYFGQQLREFLSELRVKWIRMMKDNLEKKIKKKYYLVIYEEADYLPRIKYLPSDTNKYQYDYMIPIDDLLALIKRKRRDYELIVEVGKMLTPSTKLAVITMNEIPNGLEVLCHRMVRILKKAQICEMVVNSDTEGDEEEDKVDDDNQQALPYISEDANDVVKPQEAALQRGYSSAVQVFEIDDNSEASGMSFGKRASNIGNGGESAPVLQDRNLSSIFAEEAVNESKAQQNLFMSSESISAKYEEASTSSRKDKIAIIGNHELRIVPMIHLRTTFDEGINSVLSPEMIKVMYSYCHRVDPNPRRLKRIINVLQLASEVAKVKPSSNANPAIKINQQADWIEFSKKLVKWIFLCEIFPYRMSFLIQLLLDFEQKQHYNEVIESMIMIEKKKWQAMKSSSNQVMEMKVDNGLEGDDDKEYFATQFPYRYQSVDYVQQHPELQHSFQPLPNFELDSVVSFYFKYVEKYIYCVKSAEKLSRLDGDPEEFALLLLHPLESTNINRHANNGNARGGNRMEISCRDILGDIDEESSNANQASNTNFAKIVNSPISSPPPTKVSSSSANWAFNTRRNQNFSLLDFSFNLNPSMRRQISTELDDLMSEFELYTMDASTKTLKCVSKKRVPSNVNNAKNTHITINSTVPAASNTSDNMVDIES